MNQNELLDPNLYEVIKHCSMQKKAYGITEIVVAYESGVKERIWTFNSNRFVFDYRDFLGKTKLEAVFYCDRKEPRRA